MKKFLRKLHCQRPSKTPVTVWVLNLFLSFQTCTAGSGLKTLDNSVTPTLMNSQKIMNKEDLSTVPSQGSQRTLNQVLSFQKKNKITKFVSFLISMILPLIPASNGHVSYFSLIQMVSFFTFITYYSCSVRVISCGNRKVTLDTPKTEETGQRSL